MSNNKQPIFLDSSAFFRLAPDSLSLDERRQVFKALCSIYELHVTDALYAELTGASTAEEAQKKEQAFREFPIYSHSTDIYVRLQAKTISPRAVGELSIFEMLEKEGFENYKIATDDISIFEPQEHRKYIPRAINSMEILDNILALGPANGGIGADLYLTLAEGMSHKKSLEITDFYTREQAERIAGGEKTPLPRRFGLAEIIEQREREITQNIRLAIERADRTRTEISEGPHRLSKILAQNMPPDYAYADDLLRVSTVNEAVAALMNPHATQHKEIIFTGATSPILLRRAQWVEPRRNAFVNKINTAIGRLGGERSVAFSGNRQRGQVQARIVQEPSVPVSTIPDAAAKLSQHPEEAVTVRADIGGTPAFVDITVASDRGHTR